LVADRFKQLEDNDQKISMEQFEEEFKFMGTESEKFEKTMTELQSIDAKLSLWCGDFEIKTDDEAKELKAAAKIKNDMKHKLDT